MTLPWTHILVKCGNTEAEKVWVRSSLWDRANWEVPWAKLSGSECTKVLPKTFFVRTGYRVQGPVQLPLWNMSGNQFRYFVCNYRIYCHDSVNSHFSWRLQNWCDNPSDRWCAPGCRDRPTKSQWDSDVSVESISLQMHGQCHNPCGRRWKINRASNHRFLVQIPFYMPPVSLHPRRILTLTSNRRESTFLEISHGLSDTIHVEHLAQGEVISGLSADFHY